MGRYDASRNPQPLQPTVLTSLPFYCWGTCPERRVDGWSEYPLNARTMRKIDRRVGWNTRCPSQDRPKPQPRVSTLPQTRANACGSRLRRCSVGSQSFIPYRLEVLPGATWMISTRGDGISAYFSVCKCEYTPNESCVCSVTVDLHQFVDTRVLNNSSGR